MKKFLAICLALTLLFSCTLAVSASEITAEDMTTYLIEQGIPQSFLETKEPEEISEIYNQLYGQNIRFLGTETISMTKNLDTGDVSTCGTIPEEDMTFSITTVANVNYIPSLGLDKVNMVYVYVDYVWAAGHPFFTWNDGITVNWDASVFTFQSNSFIARDYKLTLGSGGNWITTQTLTNPTELDQGGLGYFAGLFYNEVVMGNNVGAMQHKGSAYFTLLPKDSPMYLKGGASVTAINAQYLHNKNPGLLSVSFQHTSGFGISASVPGLKDSVAKAANFYYTH